MNESDYILGLSGAVASFVAIIVGVIRIESKYVSKEELPILVSSQIYTICSEVIKQYNESVQKDIQLSLAPLTAKIESLQKNLDEIFEFNKLTINRIKNKKRG
ncbi:MAG: hypothetical protein GY710_03500 [Desulfobacteraceae bacterium]|nr:hypothetical protein [Desulfobacteraceae bacterium]